MVIDGRKIASEIEDSLRLQISSLASNGIRPTLAVILIGSDPGSQKYVSRKIITGEKIGLRIIPYRFPPTISVSDLKKLTEKLNQDKTIHGIIIQRPLPLPLSPQELNLLVLPSKDVDGFHPKSRFNPPVALAVEAILKSVYSIHPPGVLAHPGGVNSWLKKKKILIIGRGETAGRPIAKYFDKNGIKYSVAHSQTTNLKELCLLNDILICCVGKGNILRSSEGSRNNVPYIVRHNMINSASIIIGVGLHPEDNKLKPDYNQEDIASKAAYYTPVPGGVGPVNVIMLMKNVIQAAKITLI